MNRLNKLLVLSFFVFRLSSAKSNSVQVMHVRSLTMKSVVRCLLVVLTVMVTNIVEPIAGKVKNQQIELRLKQLNKQALKSLEVYIKRV